MDLAVAETASQSPGSALPEACGLGRLHLLLCSGAKYTIIKRLADLFQTVIHFLSGEGRKD